MKINMGWIVSQWRKREKCLRSKLINVDKAFTSKQRKYGKTLWLSNNDVEKALHQRKEISKETSVKKENEVKGHRSKDISIE